MKLFDIIKEAEDFKIEKPKQIYQPGKGPEDRPEKDTEILPSGEVVYYDNIRLANLTKALKKEIKKYDVKNPGKVKNINSISKALDQITDILKKSN